MRACLLMVPNGEALDYISSGKSRSGQEMDSYMETWRTLGCTVVLFSKIWALPPLLTIIGGEYVLGRYMVLTTVCFCE